jgi:transcriptional regulator with XRE-family HTH domain
MTKIPKEQETLWQAFYWARNNARVTVRGFAEQMGVTAPFWSDVEHGRRLLSPEQLRKAAKLLGVAYKDLAKRKNGPDKKTRELLKAHPEIEEMLRRRAHRCSCPNCLVLD